MAKLDDPSPRPARPRTSRPTSRSPPELVARLGLGVPRARRSPRSGPARPACLPVVAGLLLVSILFQTINANFLTAGNLVNLLIQAAVFSVLAMGVVYALLLGEIDLSTGFVAGARRCGDGQARPNTGADWPWWGRSSPRLVICAVIGRLQGAIIARIGLPSFVVTLAGLLFWQGVMLRILGDGGVGPDQRHVSTTSRARTSSPPAGWVVMLADRRRSGGLRGDATRVRRQRASSRRRRALTRP